MEDENEKKEETKNKIYEYLKEGMFKKDAAIMAGISEATFYRWVEEDESFESHIEASILEFKHSLMKNVNASAVKDGRLALEVLKRRFPKEWNDDSSRQDPEEHAERMRGMKELADSFQALLRQGTEEGKAINQSSQEEDNESLFA